MTDDDCQAVSWCCASQARSSLFSTPRAHVFSMCFNVFAHVCLDGFEKGRTNACRPLVCVKVILRGWRGPFLQPGFSLRTLEDISRTQKALECGPVLQNRVSDCGKTADPMGHRHVKCQGNMSVSVMASMDAQGIRLT